MNINKVAKRDGKARSAFNVSEERTYIHPQYEIVLYGGQIGPTGLLVIATLKPKNAMIGTLPEFILRWDEKDNHLDVDPVDVSRAQGSQFKKGTSSYYGHHADKLRSGPRVFEANIGWHGQLVYRGEIRFNLEREFEAKAAIGLSASASMSSTKGNGYTDGESGTQIERRFRAATKGNKLRFCPDVAQWTCIPEMIFTDAYENSQAILPAFPLSVICQPVPPPFSPAAYRHSTPWHPAPTGTRHRRCHQQPPMLRQPRSSRERAWLEPKRAA